MGTVTKFITLAFLCSAFLAQSQDSTLVANGQELTLSEAIRVGLENNYQIQIAENNQRIAGNQNDLGYAGAYPDINAFLNVNNGYTNDQRQASFLESLSAGNMNIVPGVEAIWTLYDGGRVRLTKERLEELELQSAAQVRIAVENMVENVTLAYYEVLLRRENLDVLEEVLELSRDRIEYEEVKRDYGQSSTFDILQTEDAYLNDSTNYINQLTQYQSALHNLNQAMGVTDLTQTYALTDSLTLEGPELNLDNLQTRMLANNNQLYSLYTEREIAQINTELEESERLPMLDVRAGATYSYGQTLFGTGTFADGREQDLGGNLTKSLNGFVNFTATYNIWNGNVRGINIQNARIQELNAQLDIEQTKLDLNTQLLNNYTAYANQKQLVQVTTERLETARRNLEIAEERFRGGLINSFDYRTIQLNYINASQARVQAIFSLKQIEIQLLRLVGDLVRDED